MKIKDIVAFVPKSITPKAGKIYRLYSLPSFDDGRLYETLDGKNIQSNKYVVPDKCILFNKLNVRFKRVLRIDESDTNKVCSTEYLPLVVNESKVDYQYCYYLLISDKITNYLCGQNTNTSGSHKRINPDNFLDINIDLPELAEQKRIGKLLSDIDHKIVLNRAINQNLEAMAKQLYDYWFVQFDFPNEDGKPYKSSGGEMVWNEKLKRDIPASWKTKVIEDIADVYNGATPSTVNEQNYGGNIVWITPKDLSDQKQKFVYQGERNISQAGYNSCSTHLLPPNTILMSSRAPIGLLSIAKTELCTNQGFKSFVPKAENISTYLYYYLNIHIKQIEQLGTGTTFKEVSREDVLKFPILKPSDTILDLWEERVSALNNKQFEIQKENEYLTKLRDGLLPLLMNGQVSVNSDLAVLYIIYGLKYQNYEREHHSGDSCENAA